MKTQFRWSFLVFAFSTQLVNAQPQPTIVQENLYGGSFYDLLLRWAFDHPDTGKVIAVGKSNSKDGDLPAVSGDLDNAWIAQVVAGGTVNPQWSKVGGGDDNDEFAY